MHAKVGVYHGTVLANQLALCATSNYAVERRGCRLPCEILASAASLAAFRHLAWRRLLAFFFAFPARAAILTLLSKLLKQRLTVSSRYKYFLIETTRRHFVAFWLSATPNELQHLQAELVA